MLWNNPKVIFIHIPKTGGSSIETLAYQCEWLLGRDGLFGQHDTLQKAYDKYGDLSEYKIFTVARSPYERMVSLYLMNFNRGSFTFPFTDTKLNGRGDVSFTEFYEEINSQFTHCGDVFHYLSVNGEIPDNVKILDFNNLESEFVDYWVHECGFKIPFDFPHTNKNEVSSDSLRFNLLNDKGFQNMIKSEYRDELEYLRYMYSHE